MGTCLAELLSMRHTQNLKTKYWLSAFSILLSLGSQAASSAPLCGRVFHEVQINKSLLSDQNTNIFSLRDRNKTALETELSKLPPPLSVADRLNFEINKLRSSDPELAKQLVEVKNLKEKGKSIAVDRSHLSTSMNIFLDGAYARVVGSRGLSRPFVSFEKQDENTLIIRHRGDKFPMMVRWNADVQSVIAVHSENINGTVYQILDIPAAFKDHRSLSQIMDKHIYALISGSAINKFISSGSSQIATIAAALHDGKLIFDRPTQAEAKEVRKLIAESPRLKNQMKSLLYVAPTASGKTRVLGDAIVDLVQKSNSNKLIILATKTPDLTSELGRNIGMQLHQEVGLSKFRILQWGGQLSENMTHAELLKFIDDSAVPVVLVTSYPTVATRSPSVKEKSELLSRTRGFLVDEAHNATGETFSELLRAAKNIDSIEVLGVTASPITRTQRTIELYDGVFWASVDKPNLWIKDREKNFGIVKDSDRAIEWLRMAEQYKNAMDRGEINASEPQYYHPEEHGFKFSSIFKRSEAGTASSVNLDRVKDIWPQIEKMIEGHGPGVIHTYPRDAEPMAALLSSLTGKNFVSLQKISQEERTLVYEAFRNGSDFKGKPVHAIVGTIREGLDFPQAGWYLNFKKYVKFPENIQGPGRVVRLAHNKLNPVIIFFGEEVNKTSYSQVKDLVMSRLGKLPRQLPEGRLYSGMKRQGQRESMVKAIDNLNANMEAFLRIQSSTTKLLGADKDHLNPDAIRSLQNILNDLRYSSKNREIDLALNQFISECYSYPFFNGHLKSSWSLAEKIVSMSKLSSDQLAGKKLSKLEIEYLSSPDIVEMAKEFRGFLANIGPIPRAILETMDLKLINVTEVADAANAFVRNHNKAPDVEPFGASYLNVLLDHTLAISPQGLWRNLSAQAKSLLKNRFEAKSQQDLETTLNDFYLHTRQIPEFDIELTVGHHRDAYTNLSNKLASEMNKKILTGELNTRALSEEFRLSLEQSELLAGMVIKLRANLDRIKQETVSKNEYIQRLKEEGYFTYDYLMSTSELGILRILKELSDLNPQGQASKYVKAISNSI